MKHREHDPVKRAELHSARAILIGVDTLPQLAINPALAGGSPAAVEQIRVARDKLHTAMLDLVERLTTN